MAIENLDPANDPGSLLRGEGLAPSHWSAGPGTHFSRHHHAQPKRLYVLRGEIRFNDIHVAAPGAFASPPGSIMKPGWALPELTASKPLNRNLWRSRSGRISA